MNQKIGVLIVLCSFFTIGTFGAALIEGTQRRNSFCGNSQQEQSDFLELVIPRKYYNHTDLTYAITQYSRQLPRSTVNRIIAQAFGAWADVSALTFTRKNRLPADIEVRFAVGYHGDEQRFDGKDSVLAHATYGQVHFDDDEPWSTGLNSGTINLYSVAVHEIGHALGLPHSKNEESIMFDSYNSRNVLTKLHSEDIRDIRRLYPKKITRRRIRGQR